MIVVMIAGLLILKIMNRRAETVYVTDHIYRNTAIGMKYFLNRQTRRKAMTNENNTILSISMIITRFR
jgi:hypothetical protein